MRESVRARPPVATGSPACQRMHVGLGGRLRPRPESRPPTGEQETARRWSNQGVPSGQEAPPGHEPRSVTDVLVEDTYRPNFAETYADTDVATADAAAKQTTNATTRQSRVRPRPATSATA